MIPTEIKTIDDVILSLEQIIIQAEKNEDPLGYFAALYQKVTIKVKEGIKSSYFDDGARMEKLDVIFAKKYIDAYYAWEQNEPVSISWENAFRYSTLYWPLVLQHLLMGMNAHINLDLGIAATEISRNKSIHNLRDDFYRINEILSSLVNDVQNNLSFIWPPLKKILQKTGKLDDLLVDFSMELARDGAWEFAKQLSLISEKQFAAEVNLRDKKVATKTKLITPSKTWLKIILWIIRLGESGTVSEKINKLKKQGK